MTKLGLFFNLIKDNSWHSIKELSNALNVPQNRLSEMSKLLTEHNLIEYKQETEQVKINPKWKFICEEYNEPPRTKSSHRDNHNPSRKKRKPARHNG